METIRRILVEHPMQLVLPMAIFAATFIMGWVVRGLVLHALGTWTSRTGSHAGIVLTKALRGPILIWTAILGVHLGIQSSELPHRYTDWTAKVLLVLWIVSLTLMSMRLAGNLVRHYGDQVPGALPVTTLTQNLAQLAVVLLGIVVLLRALGLEITPILTALGVGGLAVALALQDTLSSCRIRSPTCSPASMWRLPGRSAWATTSSSIRARKDTSPTSPGGAPPSAAWETTW
ncbi:membrane hypothetical protein [Candidatus Sulfopaludibacter sp. SbA4]|nr:membrane hypothetical protein [Candidatus Sulfopaludibacter sp. SbA4]